MISPFIFGRGNLFCRGCSSEQLFSALDLGRLPIANELWSTQNEQIELFPLHLRICKVCGLGQVEDVVTPSRLFKDYRYLSSISSSFVEHARKYAFEITEKLALTSSDWVLEIASNDGYLLRNFVELGIPVLGVEPAENVAHAALAAGIPTVSEFFGTDLAKVLVEQRGHPRLIIANNVMAHVPDLRDFMAGLRILAGTETVITVENPSLMNLLGSDQFDTIYHEHYSYLTVHSVAKISKTLDLDLFKVEQIDIHGGSNRYWLQVPRSTEIKNPKLEAIILSEISAGLFQEIRWSEFANRVHKLIAEFQVWLKLAHEQGKVVCGYGAAAKASTLLNATIVQREWVAAIADESPEKQNRFMPTQGFPIISPAEMFELSPTDVIVFPWNLASEIASKVRASGDRTIRIWRAVPKLEQIS